MINKNHKIIIMLVLIILSISSSKAQRHNDSLRAEILLMINQADSLREIMKLDTAEDLADSALSLAVENFGEMDTTYTDGLSVLARIYYYLTDYEQAETMHQKSLDIQQRILDPMHPDIAKNMNGLGLACRYLGKYHKMDTLYNRALIINEKAYGKEHPEVAINLDNLGTLYWLLGDNEKAESSYVRSLEIRKIVFGKDHPEIALSYRNLGTLYKLERRFDEAIQLLSQSLGILQDAFGPDHPDVTSILHSLAKIHGHLKHYEESFRYYERFIKSRQNFIEYLFSSASEDQKMKFIRKYPLIDPSFISFALTYNTPEVRAAVLEMVLIGKGVVLDAVTAQKEIVCGTDNDNIASLYDSYIEICDKIATISLFDPEIIKVEPFPDSLRKLYREKDDVDKKLRQICSEFKDASIYNGFTIDEISGSIPEDGILFEYVNYKNFDFNRYLDAYDTWEKSLFIKFDLSPIPANSMIISAKLNLYYFLWQDNNPVDRVLNCYRILDDWHKLEVTFNDSTGVDSEKTSSAIIPSPSNWMEWDVTEDVKKYAESKQANYGWRIADDEEPWAACNIPRIHFYAKEAFPSGNDSSAFEPYLEIETTETVWKLPAGRDAIVSMREPDTPNGLSRYHLIRNRYGNPALEYRGREWYLVLTVDNSGDITLTGLGDIEKVHKALDSVKDLLYATGEGTRAIMESNTELSSKTLELYDYVLAPLIPTLGDKTRILISADSKLNLIPFEILSCPDGKYLIEKYDISYLSTGRDLLKFESEKEAIENVIIFAGPNFDLTLNNIIAQSTMTSSDVYPLPADCNPQRGVSECLDITFYPLPSTKYEAESLADIFERLNGTEVDIYSETEAREDVLKDISSRDVLHFATHSFMCSDIDLADDELFENPLLRTGIALAGANNLRYEIENSDVEIEDGILTAFEVSGLNLAGTELVALSACETGVGKIENGEGIYGLRRAFQIAGAESILMSLWKVPDYETKHLMEQFYGNWLSGQSKQRALRNSALKIIEEHRQKYNVAHPYFWGAFILLGDPN
ncbi:MAG: CHAT domain-containing protein [candidate division Zixibacteria bacterium]|nr:CHAT domain-containing protein [candidate division Zixibacteria bacterium]